jgi:hypothetical protein
METTGADTKVAIRAELDAARSTFHGLLDTLSASDLDRPSRNPGWTNGEVVFHILLGFALVPLLAPLVRFFGRLPERWSRAFARLLDAGTGVFNMVNGLGPRIGGRIFTRARLRAQYDRIDRAILRLVETTKAEEWGRSMHYPTRWEPLFRDTMTLEDVVRYPTVHLRFHLDQISR